MSIRFPKRLTILQPPPPVAGVVAIAAFICFEVVAGTTGTGFLAASGGGVTFGFGGTSSMFFSTAGLAFGRGSDAGVALKFGGMEDFFGIAVDVILGCTTAALMSLPFAPGIKELLRRDVRDGEVVVGLTCMFVNLSSSSGKPGNEKVSEVVGGIDEACECTISVFVFLLATATVIELVLARDGVIVVGFSTSAPAEPEYETTSDGDGGLDPECVSRTVVNSPSAESPADKLMPSEVVLPDDIPPTPSTADDGTETTRSAVENMDCNVDAGSEGTIVVAVEDDLSPGMSSGKHIDPSGIV